MRHIEAQDPRYFRLRQLLFNRWLIVCVLLTVASLFIGLYALLLAIFAGVWFTLNAILETYHRSQIEGFHHYKQTEALMNLHTLITIRQPLPPLRLWAASPDFLTQLWAAIHGHKPAHIVELGSGSSTLIGAYALEQVGAGHITSFDHEATFAARTREILDQHGLSPWATVHHAPLVDGWYDMTEIEPIDLLIVDGPPEQADKMTRYPALPRLFDALNVGAVILVDDYMRPQEQKMVKQWLAEFEVEIVAEIPNEKGLAILRKR